MQINLSQIDNMEFEGVDFSDYPDFVDAYLVSADIDGRELTEEEVDYLNDEHYEFVNESVFDSIF
tara:strand:+ start:942 stop:1136 length:195 start_codon:yes stop_codon:yes gene_type:complete